MKVFVDTSLENIDRRHWNALVAQSVTRNVFQTYEWHSAWWRVFGGDQEMFLVRAESEMGLVGIAPLMIRNEGRSTKVIQFIGHGEADYADFLYHEGNRAVLAGVLASLRDQSSRWNQAELRNIPGASPTIRILEDECKRYGFYCMKNTSISCPALVLKGNPDFVNRVRNKESLKRHHKYFRTEKSYRVFHLQDETKILQHLDRFFEQHISRWSRTSRPSLFLKPKLRDFYRVLLSEMGDRGWIQFTILALGETPLAYHFGFIYDNKLIWYKPSFNIELAKKSPGEALLKELLDYAHETGLGEFDFTVGDEAFKRRFSNTVRENVSVVLYKSLVQFQMHKTVQTLKQGLKKHPAGKRWIQLMKRFVDSLGK